MDIEITFINKSFDKNNSSVVIFQKNAIPNYAETVVAWHVIKNCGYDWTHKFVYPMNFYAGAKDSYGNVSDLKLATNGQKWEVNYSDSGNTLQLSPVNAASTNEVEIKNNLTKGAIDTQIYRGGKLIASKTGVSPKEKAAFQFQPYIYVGVSSKAEEGVAMSSAILSAPFTKISLHGITNANLVMTGGGIGVNATPYKFELVPVI
ncbi:hypothetical protein PG911_08140 [Tenacibaculum ovolyticum]|uniref:hypothetical protein n=1 Tax=Tenacibaculum ovolyticum TaxID=104270 RepID=UPI0007ED4300|nr:hypothetical protein [Tenacibaculum ovolyticum]WBX78212.1 hypothetical protein PG911_08140 [Tenacibaculum ovolyticum]